MINTYAELVASIADELSRDDLTYKVPEWIQLAELSLARYIKLKDGEYLTTSATVADQAWVQMPVGFKEARHVELQTDPLRILSLVSMNKRSDVLQNDTSGVPRAYSWVGRKLYLAPVPTTVISFLLYYYGLPAPLSEQNPFNDLLEMGADILKYQALYYSAPFLGEDERIGTWKDLYTEGRETLKREYARGKMGGGIMRIRPDFAPRDAHFGG
jgi:hypothetical protein